MANQIPELCLRFILGIVNAVGSTIFLPWLTSNTTLRHVLSNPDSISSWTESKVSELTNVSVTGSLIAATITGAFTWQLASGPSPAGARACWYAGLVFALMSVTMATQQSNFLNRAKCHPKGPAFLKQVIGLQRRDVGRSGFIEVLVSLYIWQVPVMLLNFSIGLVLVGITILVVTLEPTNVVIYMLAAVGIVVINHVLCTTVLYNITLEANKETL